MKIELYFHEMGLEIHDGELKHNVVLVAPKLTTEELIFLLDHQQLGKIRVETLE